MVKIFKKSTMDKFSHLLHNLCLNTLILSFSIVGTTASYAQTNIDADIAQLDSSIIKTNLYASKLGSVGNKLSPELQGKPVVIDIYASWCSACKNIAPTLSQLKQEYAQSVHFVVFDVTDKSATKKSQALAKELGLEDFFAANKSKTGTIVIVDPATGEILAMEKNNTDKSMYTNILDEQIAQK